MGKLEQDKQIITNAPNRECRNIVYLDENKHFVYTDDSFHKVWVEENTGEGDWVEREMEDVVSYVISNPRSLDDIRENIADKERIAELEKLNKTLETLMKSGERRGVEKATEELSQTLTQKDKKIAELEGQLETIVASGYLPKIMEQRITKQLRQQAKALEGEK